MEVFFLCVDPLGMSSGTHVSQCFERTQPGSSEDTDGEEGQVRLRMGGVGRAVFSKFDC